jgi:hypothetical protein
MVRIARIGRYTHDLRIFLYSIFATLTSLFWAMVLLLTVIYTFAVAFTLEVAAYSADSNSNATHVEELTQFWGSVTLSMLTLFEAISGGLSWEECVKPLLGLHWVWVVLFIAYIIFVVFAVLNIVTGAFCQSAMKTASQREDILIHEKTRQKAADLERIRRIFQEMDADGSGYITLGEMEECLDNDVAMELLASLDIGSDDAWSLFKLLDNSGDNEVSMDEFTDGLLKLKGPPKRADILELKGLLNRLHTHLKGSRQQIAELQKSRRRNFHSEKGT